MTKERTSGSYANKIYDGINAVLDVLFKSGKQSKKLCRNRKKASQVLRTLTSPEVYEINDAHGETHTYLLPYHRGEVKMFIQAFKFEYNRYARFVLTELLSEYVRDIVNEIYVFTGTVYVTAVPDTKKRVREYGSGHMTGLLKGLKNQVDNTNTCIQPLLYWTDSIRQQHTLSKKERMANVSGKMKGKHTMENKTVLVVDDVCTTGATLTEARRALLAAGAKTVYTIALAH